MIEKINEIEKKIINIYEEEIPHIRKVLKNERQKINDDNNYYHHLERVFVDPITCMIQDNKKQLLDKIK